MPAQHLHRQPQRVAQTEELEPAETLDAVTVVVAVQATTLMVLLEATVESQAEEGEVLAAETTAMLTK